MGTFFLVCAFLVFGGFSFMFLGSVLGTAGAAILSVLILAGILTVIINAWNKLSRRLERIEQALGIKPEEEAQPDAAVQPEGPEGEP